LTGVLGHGRHSSVRFIHANVFSSLYLGKICVCTCSSTIISVR
jgi:hypothetical protein